MYDNVEKYDALFESPEYLEENRQLSQMIGELKGTTIDVGCGTGLLLEISKPENYTGVDVSPVMINKFIEKFPLYAMHVFCVNIEYMTFNIRKFDNVIALFSASYINDLTVFKKLWNGKGKLFLMFYKEDYHPITHQKLNITAPYKSRTKGDLRNFYRGLKISEFNNYYIVQS